MENRSMFVGLDVHKETIDVSIAEGDRQGEVRHDGRIASRSTRWCARSARPARAFRVRGRPAGGSLVRWFQRRCAPADRLAYVRRA